jgi:hypothetical protein
MKVTSPILAGENSEISALFRCWSQSVGIPPIKLARRFGLAIYICRVCARSIEGRACRDIRVEVFVKSQLVIVHLRRLQQTANLHGTLSLFFLHLRRCVLALFREKLRIVARELLERDQEITKDNLEPVEVRVGGKETIDEG